MDANKENKHIINSKIPLPMEHLPPLPKHLMANDKDFDSMKIPKQAQNTRIPLKTINSSPSSATYKGKSDKVIRIKHVPLRVDTRHVTVRNRHEDLDWDLKVFRDDPQVASASVVTISDGEHKIDDDADTKIKFFDENTRRNDLGEPSAVVTPDKTFEPLRVRNIKRSLRRAHSRELQGLTPVPKERKYNDEEKVKRRLEFHDPLKDELKSPDWLTLVNMECLNDYTMDMLHYLLTVEERFSKVPRVQTLTRACLLNWLMKINGSRGNPAIIQTAYWYMDSILCNENVQIDKMQLVAAACYWIAQKHYGPVSPASRLVRYAANAFTKFDLVAAEKTVLERLEYPRQPVVSQEFITYLSWWCDDKNPGEIEVAATFLCLSAALVNKTLCREYPSVIAAASIRNALVLMGKKDLLMRLQMNPIYCVAVKKARDMTYILSLLRIAVRSASNQKEYKTLIDHYGAPPYYLAQKITKAAEELAIMDTRNTEVK